MESSEPLTWSFRELQMPLSCKHLINGKEQNIAEINIST